MLGFSRLSTVTAIAVLFTASCANADDPPNWAWPPDSEGKRPEITNGLKGQLRKDRSLGPDAEVQAVITVPTGGKIALAPNTDVSQPSAATISPGDAKKLYALLKALGANPNPDGSSYVALAVSENNWAIICELQANGGAGTGGQCPP